MSNNAGQITGGLFLLAAGFVVSAYILAGGIRDIKRVDDVITVTGSAKRPITSDYVIWRGEVASQQPTMQRAYREVERHVERVRGYLEQHGVPDSAVTFTAVQTRPIHEMNERGRMSQTIVAYQLSQNFEVSSRDVEGTAELSRNATELINEGVQLSSYPPQFIFTRLEELRVEMVGEATADAKERAVSIAASVGAEIGAIRSVNMGVFQIRPRHSTSVSDYGMNDTSTIEKDIMSVVRATFEIVR